MTEVPIDERPWVGAPDPEDAARRAQAYLDEDENGYIVDRDTMIPNPLQGLWIVSYMDPTNSNPLIGGGLVVTKDDVYDLPSVPDAEEYMGAIFPDDPDNPSGDDEDEEVEALLAAHAPEYTEDIEIEGLLSAFGDSSNER